MPKKALPKPTKKRSAAKPTASPSKALAVRRAPVATAKRKTSGKLAVTPTQVFPTATASYAVSHPDAVPFLLLFGTVGVALSVAATLALDTLRPAARAFGARLESAFAPDAKTPEEAARVLRVKIESSPNAQRATLEGVRRLLDSIAREAAEPLADLTAEYASGDKPVDGFFRGAARLLADLTPEEFAALRAILGRTCREDVILGRAEVSLLYRPRNDDRDGPAHFTFSRPLAEDDPRRPGTKGEWADLGPLEAHHTQHVLHVVQLLKLNALANDPRVGGFAATSGPENFVVAATVWRRLAALLGSPLVARKKNG